MTTQPQGAVQRYAANAHLYFENALEFLQREEAGKAGELLWGSVAEALQAIAAYRGLKLANHRSLRFFANAIAKEHSDSSIAQAFRAAESLHANFYEVDLEPQDIASVLEPIRELLDKLLSSIPEAVLAEAPPQGQSSTPTEG
ncbi:MAG: PaREP1 family protein [Chloroflexota bacterium]|nr:PaREP1 family protein [Chloroflexota bacterium]